MDEINSSKDHYMAVGKDAIAKGKVGAVLLAGGMGTRLGSDKPKGVFDIGITRHVYIFERLIENLMDVVNETGSYVHLFVMTSEKTTQIQLNFLKKKITLDILAIISISLYRTWHLPAITRADSLWNQSRE